MDQTIRDGSFVGLTDQEREAEIDRCCDAMIQDFESGDLDQARAWSRNMAENVAQRSDEVVEQMEKELGRR